MVEQVKHPGEAHGEGSDTVLAMGLGSTAVDSARRRLNLTRPSEVSSSRCYLH